MAKGDKKPVVMESDRAVPSGIATLDSVGNVPFEQLGNATPAAISAVPYKAVYIPNTSADDLVIPRALVNINNEINSELRSILSGTNAYVETIFYGEITPTSRKAQIAYSYNATNHKMAFRIYGANGWTKWKEISTTDNKPSGSYTGNGDATERVLDESQIGGIGRCLLVTSTQGICIVTTNGALIARVGSGVVEAVYSSKVSFYNGKLTLKTNDSALNGVASDGSGLTYAYQVL